MAVKPNARMGAIAEQIIEDPVSGLTFQFVIVDGSTAPFRLRIFGAMPNAMREIAFDRDGREAAAGSSFAVSCRATWLKKVT